MIILIKTGQRCSTCFSSGHSALLALFRGRPVLLGRGIATHPNIALATAPGQLPIDFYYNLVQKGTLKEDSQQVALLNVMTQVFQDIGQDPHTKSSQGSGLVRAQEWAMQKWKDWLHTDSTRRVSFKFGGGGSTATTKVMGRPKGVYIYGDVGSGKTIIMDMFYHALPIQRKRRIHLASFLLDIHQRLHKLTMKRVGEKQKKISEGRLSLVQSRTYAEDHHPNRMVEVIASEIAAESWVICFDEFQVTDIGDASILTSLFSLLFDMGVVIVATSNKAPQSLYHMNEHFANFISLLECNCILHQLGKTIDYRFTGERCESTYLVPDDEASQERVFQLFAKLCTLPLERNTVLKHMGREITVPYDRGGVCALFTFETLCGNSSALGPTDFAVLARKYHTLFIVGIPIMGLYNRNEARRFIVLVDELYQYRVKLICSAAAMPNKLFNYDYLSQSAAKDRVDDHFADTDDLNFQECMNKTNEKHHKAGRTAQKVQQTSSSKEAGEFLDKRFTGEEELFAFKRVESRLIEMMSVGYLRLQHTLFLTQEMKLHQLYQKTGEVNGNDDPGR